jgi:hypothetical protein
MGGRSGRRVERGASALGLRREYSFCLLLPIGGVLSAAGSVAGEEFGYGADEAHTTANQLASSASPATTELTRCRRRLSPHVHLKVEDQGILGHHAVELYLVGHINHHAPHCHQHRTRKLPYGPCTLPDIRQNAPLWRLAVREERRTFAE